MENANPGSPLAYAAYRLELHEIRMPRHVRMGAAVAFSINGAFVLLDWWIFRSQLGLFLGLRVALAGTLAFIFLRTYRTYPQLSALALCLALGWGMLAMIYATEGPASSYYAGLILLFVGMGVLLPLRALEVGSVCGVIVCGFAVSPWLGDYDYSVTQFGIHIFFLSAAAALAVASCAFLDRVRFNDFLRRREIEEARDHLKEMDRTKARFTANVHHELRTPLTLMLAPLEALLGGEFGPVPAIQRSYLKTMHSSALRLLGLINNLLELAKVEGKQLTIKRSPQVVEEIVGELVAGARPLAERKGVRLSVEVAEGLPVLFADRGALEKILVNLVGNALKFTGPGDRVGVRAHSCGSVEVKLAVHDTGMGIPPEQLERVFDRFAQVDASATRAHEGTGIGLSLVRELVELHGGRVWAESEGLGHGTTMHVVLPVGESDVEEDEEVLLHGAGGRALSAASSFRALASEMALEIDEPQDARFTELEHSVERWEGRREAAGAELEGLPEHPQGTPEVVIAEDNVDMRRLLTFLIGREFRVRPTRNGREALEAVRERAPALVVTDVMMPEMSGTELCRALKEDDATRAIPVMLVTSKAEREMKIEGLELGADDYVTKPFHPRELLARVRSLVRIRQLQEELAERNASLEESNRELARALEELKEAEVQLVHAERLAAVGELSAGVAHEVNNPLNFARNALATLGTYVEDLRGIVARLGELDFSDREGLVDQLEALRSEKEARVLAEMADELSELMGIVAQGLDRTMKLVGDMRDFAAPHRGDRALVDVGAGLGSTVQLLGQRMREAEAVVELSVEEGLPRVAGDPGALNQVFLNLLKNAAEALEGQGGTISVSAATAADAGVIVRVQDGGPGMDSEAMTRLFEPFFTTKKAGRGTGLGLAISRRIVEGHGGRIDVESRPGKGTCVTVWLPARGGAEDAEPHGA